MGRTSFGNLRIAAMIMCLLLFSAMFSYAENITISLNFPKKSSTKFGGIKAIPAPIEVSGIVTLSVWPYPGAEETDQCLVEYFLEKELLYKTTGLDKAGSGILDFKFEFDSTQFPNGDYRLYVNYWDKEGNSAIGSHKIVINNKSKE